MGVNGSFAKLNSPLPEVSDPNWPRPIDRFVLRNGQRRPNPLPKPTVDSRRLYLDLTGLPPTPDKIKGFLEDKRAYEPGRPPSRNGWVCRARPVWMDAPAMGTPQPTTTPEPCVVERLGPDVQGVTPSTYHRRTTADPLPDHHEQKIASISTKSCDHDERGHRRISGRYVSIVVITTVNADAD